MVVGHIVGLVFLPVSILLFLNAFGVTSLTSVLGIDMLLIGAIGIIFTEAGDVIDAHVKKESIAGTWVACVLLSLPTVIYFISIFAALPQVLVGSLALIIPSFLFVEGLSGFAW